jgi:hypothetical protein
VIVRHQRESASNRGFRHLARYIQGRDSKPRATWFLAANLPGVTGRDGLELACKLVDAVQAQNTRSGTKRTYHLVISLHPDDRRLERKELRHVVDRLVDTLGFSEHQYIAVRHSDTDHEHIHVAINKIHAETFRIHSPAWDHQKLFTGARALERELGLTPLRSRTRDRERIPRRAADCEAHHEVESFARWAREKLRPTLRATELRSWDDVHDVCSRFGVMIRAHGNGLVFEDADRGVRVKASFVARELSKTRLFRQLKLRQTIETRALKQKHATQRWGIQKTPHPGTWHHFMATRVAERDAPCEEPATGTRPVQRGKGVVRFSEGVEIQFGDPNARRGAPQVDITS